MATIRYDSLLSYLLLLAAVALSVRGTDLKHSCNISTHRKCCNCEAKCVNQGDCCLDKFSEEYSGSNYIGYFLNKTKIRKFYRYINIINKRIVPTIGLSERYMISKCDNSFSEFYENCNNVYDEDDYPVYDERGTVYRNNFCAKCHNSSVIYHNVNLTIRCNAEYTWGNSSNFSLKDRNDCSVDIAKSMQYLIEDRFKPSKREKLMKRSERIPCESKDLLLCNSYLAIVNDQYGKMYANKHCALCYNNYEKIFTFEYCHREYKVYKGPVVYARFQFSFSLMVGQTANGMVTDRQFCKSGFVFDLSKGECVVSVCNPGYIKRGDLCTEEVRDNIMTINAPTSTEVALEKRKKDCINDNTRYVRIEVLEEFDPNRYSQILLNATTHSNASINESFYILQKTDKPTEFVRNLEELVSVTGVKKITYFITDFFPLDAFHDVDDSHTMAAGRLCISPRIYVQFNISEKCNPIINGSEYDLMQNTTFWMVKKDKTVSFYASVCSSFYLHSKCMREFYSNHKYKINESTKVVTIRNKKYAPEQYHPTLNGVEICLSTDLDSIYQLPYEGTIWYVENIISVFFLIISLISELVTTVLFGVIKDLQNTPGRIIMSIALTAFINDILVTYMAFSVLTEEVCSILAIVLHWFSIALSIWSLCFSLDSWKTLRKSFQVRVDSKKSFLSYIIAVLVVSSLVLALALIFESLTSFDVSYGKASEGLCWIRSKHARLAFYIVPTYVALVLSAALLICMIYNVKKNAFSDTVDSVHSARIGNTLNLKVMVLKMIFALGIVELLPLIEIERTNQVSAIANHIVSFLNNVFRSLRGTIVMVIFVFSKAVRNKVCNGTVNKKVWIQSNQCQQNAE